METRVGVYIRVFEGQRPGQPLRELRAFTKARGWEIAGEYVDCIADVKERGPQLNRLMDAAKKRQFDIIIVWHPGRMVECPLETAMNELSRAGVSFMQHSARLAGRPENIDVYCAEEWCFE